MQDVHCDPSLEFGGGSGDREDCGGMYQADSCGWILDMQHLAGWTGYMRYGRVLWVSGKGVGYGTGKGSQTRLGPRCGIR